MQREVSSRNFVRGSSTNAPFLPGGVSFSSPTTRSHVKLVQKTITAYVNVETSPIFPTFGHTYIVESLGLAIQYDDSSDNAKILRMDSSAPVSEDRPKAMLFGSLVRALITPSASTRDEFQFRELKREREEERQKRKLHIDDMRQIATETASSVLLSSSSSSSLSRSDLASSSSSSSPSISFGSLQDSSDLAKYQGGDQTGSWLKTAQRLGASSSSSSSTTSEWAVTERMQNIGTDFSQLVEDPAIIYHFEMDDFQKEAAYHLEQGETVFIAAHTSAGKTVVAEYAIALAMKHGTRAIYTSPIKALSNQKYRDFKDTFGDTVGLITGDTSVHSDAPCLIVTTEILRSMLYKGADLVRDVEWVIFDEVHYLNDPERGVVWEEVIVMLPDHVGMIFLSATVPNSLEFADWVGRMKRRKVFVISTDKRPVPLEHYLYYDKNLYKIFDAKAGFMPEGHGAVTTTMRLKQAKKEERKPKRTGASAAPRNRTSFASQRGTWANIVAMLHARDLLPAVGFVFSKKKCMDLAQSLEHIDLTNREEKDAIRKFIDESIKRLKGSDRDLPQVNVIRGLLMRGIGVHHSGLLPIVKEIVELLFSTSLIRMLFATETFAMGVNMPTRTVVFNDIQKHSGSSGLRPLEPGEYIQMSGRAGRRGLDNVGTVIIAVFHDVPDSASLRELVTGKATRLSSQFRLTYNMILNLMKMGKDFHITDMIKRSFFESSNQKEAAMLREKMKMAKAQAKDIEEVHCLIPEFQSSPEAPIVAYYSLVEEERMLMRAIQLWLVKSKYIQEMLCLGRVLVVNIPGLPRQSLATVVRAPGTVPVPRSISSDAFMSDVKSTSIRVLVLTGSAGRQLTDKYKVSVVDSASHEIAFVTQKKLKMVDSERIDIAPDEYHITSVIKDLDDVRIESLPGLPPALDAVKHLKVTDMDFVEMNRQLKEVRDVFATSPCHDCEHRAVHLAKQERSSKLKAHIKALDFLLSDQNLLMIPEYEARIQVLKKLDFINEDGIVQLKGRVARELNNCDELIATELIFDNTFTHMPPDEICALLSCFVLQGKSKEDPVLPPALKERQKLITGIATKLGELQVDLGVPITPQEYVEENVQIGLMEVVLEWARNKPFQEIMKLTDYEEGSIVRTIVRLDETLRDFKTAAKLIGNVDLATKMDEASHLIKRDIVFASSLYISEAPAQQQAQSSGDGSAIVIDDEY